MLLMEKFHEFYGELRAVHEQLDAGKISADRAHERLASMLNRQEGEAQRELGQYGLDTFLRAKYAMAALADELLLRDSRHDLQWMGQLLETALFRSQRAGEKVFDDITEMQNLGTAAADLARVYLAVLGLGFQGVYRDIPNSDRVINTYREKLYNLACGTDPVIVTGRRHLAPGAYASTLTDGEGGQLPHLKPWIYMLVLLAVLYFTGGSAIWHDATVDIVPVLNSINDNPATATSGGNR